MGWEKGFIASSILTGYSRVTTKNNAPCQYTHLLKQAGAKNTLDEAALAKTHSGHLRARQGFS